MLRLCTGNFNIDLLHSNYTQTANFFNRFYLAIIYLSVTFLVHNTIQCATLLDNVFINHSATDVGRLLSNTSDHSPIFYDN